MSRAHDVKVGRVAFEDVPIALTDYGPSEGNWTAVVNDRGYMGATARDAVEHLWRALPATAEITQVDWDAIDKLDAERPSE
jgi:hypothetical protein